MREGNRAVKNATWLVACHIAQAVINLIVNLLTARYFGPSDFGVISYAASIVAFVVPIMQLGFNSILVQELVSKPEKEGETLGTAILLNIASAFVTMGFVTLFVFVVNHGEKETLIVCALYSISLIFQATYMIRYWFQAKLLSKYTAVTSLIVYTLVAGYRFVLLIAKTSIYWFAISQALDFLLISAALLVIYNKLNGQKLSFSFKRGKEMLSVGRYYIVSAMMVTIFAQTDKIMLKIMVDDRATGLYSVAVTCAGMTSFVFAAIIDSLRPIIVKNKLCDKQAYEKNMSLLYAIITYFSLIQSVFISLFANIIIKLLYGIDYMESADILRLVVWYTTFSYLGAVRDVWILAEEKQRYLWVINFTGAMTNVVLNLWLIPIWGTMGAALASLITQMFTNVVLGFIIKPIRQNNALMLKGLDVRLLNQAVRIILKR